MSTGKVTCPACRFEFSPEEALLLQEGRGCPRCKEKLLLPELPPPEDPPAEKESCHLLSDGTIFDKYRIIGFIGSGGMGEVYKAEHLLLKQFFALKVMKEIKPGKESTGSKRFLREAKCFHLLDHPNIIRVFDIGCDRCSGLLYISMEFLPGKNLKSEKKLSESELLKIASDIAKALEELERNCMVHRDIKPSNIMRDAKGNCKLMDLGIARNRWENGDEHTLTLDSCLIGTPSYVSPEQCRSPHDVDIRSDIYSLGVTLYHLASGQLPYQGETPIETILNVIHKAPPSLRKLAPELSGNFIELVECMMEKSPEKRPPDALTLRRMIETVQQGNSPEKLPEKIYSRRNLLKTAAYLLCAGAAAASVWFFAPQKKSAIPPQTPQVPQPPAAVKTKQPESNLFLQQDFITRNRSRTLKVRLEEFKKIISYLSSGESEGLPMRDERLKLFTSWRQKLELLQKRRDERQKRRTMISPAPELKADIERYLKTSPGAFTQTRTGVLLARRIMAALHKKEMDPDTLFSDSKNEKRSLTGLLQAGMLPMGELLLRRLIFFGADINAGLGSELPPPVSFLAKRAKARLTGIAAFNGADNVDTQYGRSLLLSVLDPEHAYLVCRPSGNHLDWPLANFLVESGARLDVKNSQGRTPVHFAALHNRGDLLYKMLLAGSPDGKTADSNGDTPFLLAVRNHAVQTTNILIRFGMSTPVTEADRAQGMLISGIMNNEFLRVEDALDRGASLEYRYANKLNALQNAVIFRHEGLVKLLLEKGADLESGSDRISLPGISICSSSPAIFRLILERLSLENMTAVLGKQKLWLPGAVLDHFWNTPDLAGKFFDAMLACRWEIDREGPGGLNALEKALSRRNTNIEVIRLLLAKGADPALFLARKKVSLNHLDAPKRQLITAAAKSKVKR